MAGHPCITTPCLLAAGTALLVAWCTSLRGMKVASGGAPRSHVVFSEATNGHAWARDPRVELRTSWGNFPKCNSGGKTIA